MFAHFVAMQSLAELEDLAMPQVLAEAYGAEKAGKIMQSLGESADATVRIIRLVPDLSNPGSDDSGAPPAMILYNGFRVAAEHTAEFTPVSRRSISCCPATSAPICTCSWGLSASSS